MPIERPASMLREGSLAKPNRERSGDLAALAYGSMKDGVLLEGRSPSEFKAAEELSKKTIAEAESVLGLLKVQAIKEEESVSSQELMAAEANLEALQQDHAKRFLN